MAPRDWPASHGASPCAGRTGCSVFGAESFLFLPAHAFPCMARVGAQSVRKKQQDFPVNSSSSLLPCSSQLLFLAPRHGHMCSPLTSRLRKPCPRSVTAVSRCLAERRAMPRRYPGAVWGDSPRTRIQAGTRLCEAPPSPRSPWLDPWAQPPPCPSPCHGRRCGSRDGCTPLLH